MRRTAILGGIRTPFVKAGTAFQEFSFRDLGAHVLKASIEQFTLDPSKLDEFIFGTVLLDPRAPNWAREIVFQAGLPKSVYAHAVSNNCISGLVAITSSAERIALGRTQLAIAGGAESMSNPAVLFGKEATKRFLGLSRARDVKERLKVLSSFRPGHFKPAFPTVTDPTTGLSMGEHMEITAKEMHIPRDEQDKIALASHQNAAKAIEAGVHSPQIAPFAGINKDTIVRGDTSLEKLAKLKPVFDRSEKGTLTAGNSSPLTDGASVVVLSSEERAAELGKEPLAFIRDYEYSAIDPHQGLLMAPAIAVPRMLQRNNLRLEDFDLIEIHEAFAAQVLANIKAWEQGWKEPAVGKVDRTKLNVVGGSIALGHPFAATGGRIVTSLANELKRRNLKRGLISICAAGAMGGAMIIER
jgi:acetyl-CoA acetyltransferase family protein